MCHQKRRSFAHSELLPKGPVRVGVLLASRPSFADGTKQHLQLRNIGVLFFSSKSNDHMALPEPQVAVRSDIKPDVPEI